MIRRASVLLPAFVVFATLFLHAPVAAKSEKDVIVLRPGRSKVFGFKRPPVPAGEVLEGTKVTRLVDITNIKVAPRWKKKGTSATPAAADTLVEVEAKKTRGGLKVSTVKRAARR